MQKYKSFLDKWYGEEEWRWGYYPLRVPRGGAKRYYWNEKCLIAPKPYYDDEGYFYWRNWVIRKVIPGLLPMPRPIEPLPILSTDKIRAATKQWIELINSFNTDALDAAISEFGGDHFKPDLVPSVKNASVIARMPRDWEVIPKPFSSGVDSIYPIRAPLIIMGRGKVW